MKLSNEIKKLEKEHSHMQTIIREILTRSIASEYRILTKELRTLCEEAVAVNGSGKEYTANLGFCPVPVGTLVDVKYRFGSENLHVLAGVDGCRDGSIPALNAYDWLIENTPFDIVSWRLHKPEVGDK